MALFMRSGRTNGTIEGDGHSILLRGSIILLPQNERERERESVRKYHNMLQ